MSPFHSPVFSLSLLIVAINLLIILPSQITSTLFVTSGDTTLIKSHLEVFGDLYVEGEIRLHGFGEPNMDDHEPELDPGLVHGWNQIDLAVRHKLRYTLQSFVTSGPVTLSARCSVANRMKKLICRDKNTLSAYSLDLLQWGPAVSTMIGNLQNPATWIMYDGAKEFFYVFGGDSSPTPSDAFFRYEVENIWQGLSDTFEQFAISRPSPRTKIRAASTDKMAFFHGGYVANTAPSNELFMYSMQNHTFVSMGSYGTAVSSAYTLIYNDFVYIYGGEDAGFSPVTELKKFGPVTGGSPSWSSISAGILSNTNNAKFVYVPYDGLLHMYMMDQTAHVILDFESESIYAQGGSDAYWIGTAPNYIPGASAYYQNTIFVLGSSGSVESWMV